MNSPWYLLAKNAGTAVVYIVTVSGAYFFVLVAYPTFSPRCYEFSPVHEAVCNFSTVALWTFPLVCLVAALILFSKNILDSRLYYECLLNTILLDYENHSLNHPMVWFLVLWGASTLICHFYVTPGWIVTDVAYFVFSMLAYYGPIASFLCLFLMHWQVESNLLPLAKFTETDPHYSVEVLAAASENFAPEPHFRAAFENVNDFLTTQEKETIERGGQVKGLRSKKFFGFIAEELAQEIAYAHESWKAEHDAQAAQDGAVHRAVDGMAVTAGLVRRPEYARYLGQSSRPDVVSISYNFGKPYWVYRILFHSRLSDARSQSFRNWFNGYLIFCALMLLLVSYAFVCTVATFLVFEEITSENHWTVKHFHLPTHRPYFFLL